MLDSNSAGTTSEPIVWPAEFTLKDGRRVTIRPLAEEDAEATCEGFPKTHVESDFLMYMPGEFDLSIEQERAWIRDRNRSEKSLILTAECDGQLVAFAGAESPKFKRQQHQAELGVTVVKPFWGQGLGRRLTEYLIAWASARDLRKLTLRVFDGNKRAIALYQSLGFVEEGRLKEEMLRADGRYTDVIVMAKHFPRP